MRTAAAALAACVLAAGCGDAKERASSTPSPAPKRSLTGPEAEPGGAGDEQPIVQRVRLTVSQDRRLTPRRVKVSAFLAADLSFRNRSSRKQLISVTAAGATRGVQAAPGRTVTMHLEGQRPGAYRIAVADGGRATLIAAADTP